MISFAADENLNDSIVCGLLRRRPDLDIVRIRDTPMREASDPAVLEWAATEGRVVPTRDAMPSRRRMIRHQWQHRALSLDNRPRAD